MSMRAFIFALSFAYTGATHAQAVKTLFEDLQQQLLEQDDVSDYFSYRLSAKEREIQKARGAFDPLLSVGSEASPLGDYDDRRAGAKLKQKLPFVPIDAHVQHLWGQGQSPYDGKYTSPEFGRAQAGVSVDALRLFGARPETFDVEGAKISRTLEAQNINVETLSLSFELIDALSAFYQAHLSVLALEGLLSLDKKRVEAVGREVEAGLKNRLDLLDAQRRLKETLSLYASWQAKRKAQWQKTAWWTKNPPPMLSDETLAFCKNNDVRELEGAKMPEVLQSQTDLRLALLDEQRASQLWWPELRLEANVSQGFGDAGRYGKFSLDEQNNIPSLDFKGYQSTERFDFWLSMRVEVPLLNRKARFQLLAKQAKAKSKASALAFKTQKAQAALDALFTLKDGSCEAAAEMGEAQERALDILRGEQKRYEAGEVSLFQALQRESKALEIELKYAKLSADSLRQVLRLFVIDKVQSEG